MSLRYQPPKIKPTTQKACLAGFILKKTKKYCEKVKSQEEFWELRSEDLRAQQAVGLSRKQSYQAEQITDPPQGVEQGTKRDANHNCLPLLRQLQSAHSNYNLANV